MRLDLYLKASRISPRRSAAQELCDAGAVSINGKTAKSAHAVKPGDEITIRTRARVLAVRVETVPIARNTSKKEAPTLYQIIREEELTDPI